MKEQVKNFSSGMLSVEVNARVERKKITWQTLAGNSLRKHISIGLEQCPATVYKEFKKRRPKSMLEEDSPFFLQVNRYHCDKPGKDHWYLARPMGKNKISEIMKSAAKDAKSARKPKN